MLLPLERLAWAALFALSGAVAIWWWLGPFTVRSGCLGLAGLLG